MSTDFQIAAPQDVPTMELSSMRAAFEEVSPDPNAAPTVNPGFSASMSFQAAANFQPALAPEPAPEDVHVEAQVNPDLMQGIENTTYALANAQLSGGSWLTDSMNVAMTAMDNVSGIKQTIQPAPAIEADFAPQAQYTQTLTMNAPSI